MADDEKPATSSNDQVPETGGGNPAGPQPGSDPAPSSDSGIARKKADALSLIDEKPRRRRRRKAGTEEVQQEPSEPKRTVEDDKKDALSLFEESERRGQLKGRKKILNEAELEKKKSGEKVLPPISRIKAEEEEKRRRRRIGQGIVIGGGSAAAAAGGGTGPKSGAEGADAAGEGSADDTAPAKVTPAKVAAKVAEDGDEDGELEPGVIHIKPPIIVKDLAELMELRPFVLIKDLIELDVFADTNKSIEPEIAGKLCEKHGFVFEKERREKGGGVHKPEEVVEEPAAPVEEEETELKLRAPIVTFMGHVDHGKTSLLDAIRHSRVTEGEAGGITQHVAAYSVQREGKRSITFLDTPGHAAFTKMRERGANVTDIVVIIVAADDGIMPQTMEAISHARAAEVKLMVAINKCDLPAANLDRVKAQLQEQDLAPEDWGGNTTVVEVSAATGDGIDNLLELILLESELLELKANPDAVARASVIEARKEPGRGASATVIVQSGTFKVGTAFICGAVSGKIKSLHDDQGKTVKTAGPSMPVEVVGFSGLPNVGDELVEMDTERAAKKLGEERLEILRNEKLSTPKRSVLETLFADADKGGALPVLKIVLKSDVQGSSEAIVGALEDIQSEKIDIDFLLAGAGAITESDIDRASASGALVIGFNTKLEGKAVKAAKREGVEIKLFSIIYELIDQVKEAMLGMLDPEHRETVTGHAEVKQVFKTSKGKVGGCMVTDGRIARKARARVLRGRVPVYDGGLATLRRYEDEVAEVRNGLECGIKLGDFNDYEVGDIIECYELEKLEQTL